MLAAIAVAGEVRERAVGRGHGSIFLFDAAPHFRDQGFLQRPRRGQHVICVAVLAFEMLSDHWVEQARVAHHPLPIRVLQPGKFVSEDNAMTVCFERTRRRCWNRKRLDGSYRTGARTRGLSVIVAEGST